MKISSRIYLVFCLLILGQLGSAQYYVDGDTLYGDEWIKPDQDYYKMKVAEDGWYNVDKSTLIDAGFPWNSIDKSSLQVYNFGKEIPIVVSEEGIQFYGEKNRVAIESITYNDPSDPTKDAFDNILNPELAYFQDTSAYFLTWKEGIIGDRFDYFENVSSDNYKVDIRKSITLKELYWFKGNYRNPTNSNHFEPEGYCSSRFVKRSFDINLENINLSEKTDSIQIDLLAIKELNASQVDILWNNKLILSESFIPNTAIKRTFSIPISLVQEKNKLTLSVQKNESSGNVGKICLSQIYIKYPTEISQIKDKYANLTIPEGGNLNISLPSNGYILVSPRDKLISKQNGIGVNLSNASDLVYTNNLFELTNIKKLKRLEIDSQANILIVTHEKLEETHSGKNQIEEYVRYRESSEGGGYKISVVHSTDLYDYFSFGVLNPYGVKNGVLSISRRLINLHTVFLVGHGKDQPYFHALQKHGLPNLVPGIGTNASDLLYVSEGQKNILPKFKVGRLPASSPRDLEIYLQKVKEYEQKQKLVQDQDTRSSFRNIIHISGGKTEQEQSYFARILENWYKKINDSNFNPNLKVYAKGSSDIIFRPEDNDVYDEINSKGSSIITYFGHSGRHNLEYGITSLDRFDNKGSYPIMMVFGCSAGNAFSTEQTSGESFLFAENKGVIAFVASTGPQYGSTLNSYGLELYNNIGSKNYGNTLGSILYDTYYDVKNNRKWIDNPTQLQTIILGDPMLRYNYLPGPDLIIDESSVKLNPIRPTSQDTSLLLSFKLDNIGTTIVDSVDVLIELHNDNTKKKTSKLLTLSPEGLKDTLVINFKLDPSWAGQNRISFHIDPSNAIEELPNPIAEQNNLQLSPKNKDYKFFISNYSINLDWPEQYQVVCESRPTLFFNGFLKDKSEVILEIDTSSSFDSPWKKVKTISADDDLEKYTFNEDLIEGLSYFWRIGTNSSGELLWKTSSFTFLPEQQGWVQKDKRIIANNIVDKLEKSVNSVLKRNRSNVEIRFSSGTGFSGIRSDLHINNKPYSFNVRSGLFVVVLDSLQNNGTWSDYKNSPYGSKSSALRTAYDPTMDYELSTVKSRTDFIDLLQNKIPSGSTVIVGALYKRAFTKIAEEWAQDSLTNNGLNVFNVLESFGATKIRNLETKGVAYIFSFVKNGPVIAERIGQNFADPATLTLLSKEVGTEGFIYSPDIGPAKSWKKLSFKPEELAPHEKADVIITALDENKRNEIVLDTISGENYDLSNLDAKNYPYIRMIYREFDDSLRTYNPLDYWKINYQPFPDIRFVKTEKFEAIKGKYRKGEELNMSFGVKNLSKEDLNKIAVIYTFRNERNTIITLRDTLADLKAGEERAVSFKYSSDLLTGSKYQYSIELQILDETEYNVSNNFYNGQFNLDIDEIKPSLQVLFDGEQIISGDIVSASPEISICLEDENQYLRLDDPSLVNVKIESPSEQITELNMDSDEISITYPNEGDKNKMNIVYTPTFAEDGVYRMSIKATDKSGNEVADHNFLIEFEVITETTVSQIVNYPNPFTTSTRFAYTLTGSNVPLHYKIQIFSPSGKVVRELTEIDLGPLKVGKNLTEKAWDGYDEYGSKLANGVYLYRFIVKDDAGTTVKRRNTPVDNFVKGEFNKLVILR